MAARVLAFLRSRSPACLPGPVTSVMVVILPPRSAGRRPGGPPLASIDMPGRLEVSQRSAAKEAGHATATRQGARASPGAAGGAAQALPAADRRPAADDRAGRAPPRADLPGRRRDHQVLPGVSRLPAGGTCREPRLRRLEPLLLRHRQP